MVDNFVSNYYTQDHEGNFKPPVENWEDVIHLNYYNSALRREMIDAMRFWVNDCGIDGSVRYGHAGAC
jgi:glycosidase